MAEILNLQQFFIKEARASIIPSQKRLLENKKGVANDFAPHNKQSTVKQKGFDHWLKNTGETKANVFQFRAEPNKLTIFASPNQHSGRRTYKTKGGSKTYQSKSRPQYSELIGWHTEKYSGFYRGLPSGSAFPLRLKTEIKRQIKEHVKLRFGKFFNK